MTDIHLEADETKSILYYALMSDIAGTYTLHTEAGYLEAGVYSFLQEITLDITVDKNALDIAGDIINALNGLSLSGGEESKRDKAVRYLNKVRDRAVESDKDIEKNIHDINKAIHSLIDIETVDISGIRLMMDELLKTWESRYYFFSS